jgi:HSP20 family protein
MLKLANTVVGICFGLTLAFHPAWADQAADEQELRELKEKMQKLEERLQSSRTSSPTEAPLAEMDRLREKMNQMFEESFSRLGEESQGILNGRISYTAGLDMQETKDAYVIKMDAVGFDKESIDVKADGNMVTVSGQSSQEQETKGPNQMQSKSYGSFSQMISLPEDADTSRMDRTKEGDMLVIRVPKEKST